MRFWTLAWGLYPRRIYMKEKGIFHDFEIIPVHFTKQGQMDSAFAIIEYLEELYTGQGPVMIGSSSWERARTRDCLAVLDEAVAFFACYGHNASAAFAKREPQSKEAARVSLVSGHKLFAQLEALVDAQGPFLMGKGEQPIVLDCMVMATLQFYKEAYDVDLTIGHPRLHTMHQAFASRKSAEWDEEVPETLRGILRDMLVR
ncbi:hypothetical protein LTR27_000864 [Elasticomyces elasticus]|nr:hypothetical protein LTR27_000864 [Elasticomyces elasticus]